MSDSPWGHNMPRPSGLVPFALLFLVIAAPVCSAQVTDVFRDPNMDFGSIRTVSVLPFAKLSRDQVIQVLLNLRKVDRETSNRETRIDPRSDAKQRQDGRYADDGWKWEPTILWSEAKD